ncbi:MAG: bifunctional glutamate N-acetyltransferase/amino-acid acetyltransferase ArgJ [Thermacetogeniaceae bacterium]
MSKEHADWVKAPGGITAPQGFKAAGVVAQVRKKGRRDLALICSEVPAVAAGLFTRNLVKAAPVILSQEHLANGRAQAIVANSGIANAYMGAQGMADARRMADVAAESLDVPVADVVVASTGVIGEPLPIMKIEAGIRDAAANLTRDGGGNAAEAIMTTDTAPKEYALKFSLGDSGPVITIGGIAKGSGMIHPNLATMLSFLTTDAAVDRGALEAALRYAADRSYNAVTIDGDTSTNDMVVILANGQAGNVSITAGSDEFITFRDALAAVCIELAKMIAHDGEGATKYMEVRVRGAQSEQGALQIARTIAGSNLVKAALFGEDANWGRIITAAGYSGVLFDPERVTIWIGDLKMADGGTGLGFDEERAKEILEGREIEISLDLHQGDAEGVAWGCDLSYDYVRINANYRT